MSFSIAPQQKRLLPVYAITAKAIAIFELKLQKQNPPVRVLN